MNIEPYVETITVKEIELFPQVTCTVEYSKRTTAIWIQ